MPAIKSMRIIFHGYEHAQYFQGHGVSYTRYTDCATGAGSSNHEALNDALECLYLPHGLEISDAMVRECLKDQGDPTIEALEAREDSDYHAMHEDCPSDESEHEGCELYYHVSIDVEIG